jgi:hypothetical protein
MPAIRARDSRNANTRRLIILADVLVVDIFFSFYCAPCSPFDLLFVDEYDKHPRLMRRGRVYGYGKNARGGFAFFFVCFYV